jgi:hypothetical protein
MGLLLAKGLLDSEPESLPLDGDEEARGPGEARGREEVAVDDDETGVLLKIWKKLQLAISMTFFTSDSSSLPSHITSLDCLAFRY